MESEDDSNDYCPTCGNAVSSLDEACPYCLLTEDPEPEAIPYEYFKTFKNRTSFRYRPDEFVVSINEWLLHETGLINLGVVIHRVQGGLISGVTLSCYGINLPTKRLFQFQRIVLAKGTFSQKATPLGEALNEWKERNPDKKMLRFVPLTLAAMVSEVWILFVSVAPDPALSEDAVRSAT